MFLDYSIHFSDQKDLGEYIVFPVSFEYFTKDDWLELSGDDLIKFKDFVSKYKYIFVIRNPIFENEVHHPDDTILFTNDVYLWDKIRNEMLQVFEIGAKHNVIMFCGRQPRRELKKRAGPTIERSSWVLPHASRLLLNFEIDTGTRDTRQSNNIALAHFASYGHCWIRTCVTDNQLTFVL